MTKHIFSCIFLLFIAIISLYSSSAPVYTYKLENGLEAFIIENNDLPLITIEIAIKAGSSYQTPKTDGLFHLYEHILFKGNSLYPSSASCQAALLDLGVTNWNGSTSNDYINYYFTIPSNAFEEGVKFWAAALQNPLFDENELEREKKVVISEINGIIGSSMYNMRKVIHNTFYPNEFYRIDPSGNPETVQNCTIDDLRNIQYNFYKPDNCSIYIAGNITISNAKNMIEKYFGNWKSPNTENTEYKPDFSEIHKKIKPSSKDTFYIQRNNSVNGCQLYLFYKGPNAIDSLNDTYAIDLLSSLINQPNSKFTRNIFSITNTNNNSAVSTFYSSYLTNLTDGIIQFSFIFDDYIFNLANKLEQAMQYISLKEIPELSKNLNYFQPKNYSDCKDSIIDANLISQENPLSEIEFYRFFWAVTNTNYALSYYDNVRKIDSNDINYVVNKYLFNKNYLAILVINEKLYNSQLEDIYKLGFIDLDKGVENEN